MCECGTKVGSIESPVAARGRVVDLLARGAVQSHGLHERSVREARGQHRLLLAGHAGTATEGALLELLVLNEYHYQLAF